MEKRGSVHELRYGWSGYDIIQAFLFTFAQKPSIRSRKRASTKIEKPELDK